MANRGLYGQDEGNGTRNATEQFGDRLDENWLVEGEWLTPMIEAAKKGKLQEMGRLRDKMKTVYIDGGVPPVLAQDRADSVLRQAMGKLKI